MEPKGTDFKTWGLIGLSVIIIILVILWRMAAKKAKTNAGATTDLINVAKGYNALVSGIASPLKDDQLSTLTMQSNGFLSTTATGTPV